MQGRSHNCAECDAKCGHGDERRRPSTQHRSNRHCGHSLGVLNLRGGQNAVIAGIRQEVSDYNDQRAIEKPARQVALNILELTGRKRKYVPSFVCPEYGD